ncbi:macrophage migration inhibitory factor-like [Styela clava]
MPSLTITTNVPKDEFPKDFLAGMTEILAKSLGKPEKYICVVVHPGTWMSFAGTEEACANCKLESIGKLSQPENIEHTKAIMSYLSEKLRITKDRMYIAFRDSSKADMGYNGTTFAA